MTKFYAVLLLWLAFLVAHDGHAQAPPAGSIANPAVRVAPAPTTLTRADTARAIRRLFKSRRGGGAGWLGFGTASILASTLPALQTTSAGVWTPGVVAGSAFLLIGLNKRIQFRPGRERQVLRELAATGHLPTSVARRLRKNFAPIRGAATDYDPLTAPDIRPAAITPALTPAQSAEAAHADTLRAINRLFARRRKGGHIWNYLALSGALGLTRALVTGPNNGDKVDGSGIAILAGGFIVAPIAIGVVNLTTTAKPAKPRLKTLTVPVSRSRSEFGSELRRRICSH